MIGEAMEEEDLLILRALDGVRGQATGDLDESGETLLRLYTETFGILAYALEPTPPPPGLRARLLARREEAPESKAPSPAARPTGTLPPPASATQTRPMAIYRPAPPAAAEPPPARRSRRWPAVLAALFALGFMGLSGWLFYQLQEEKAQLTRLGFEIKTAREQGGQAGRLRSELSALRDSFELVSAPGIVCPLRPVMAQGVTPPQPAARGVLFIAADHQHWYLSLHGLQPNAPGRQYQLWWLVGSASINGGTFDVKPGEPVRLSSPWMPAGTVGAAITVEPQGGTPAPTGPQILKGDQIFQVL